MSGESERKGINGRLRPRKPNTTYVHQLRNLRKSEQLRVEEGSPSSPEVQSPKIEDIFLPTLPSTAKHVFEHGKQPYLCLFCDRQFPLRQSLCKHMQRVHQRTSRRENNIRCPYCGQKEANVDKLFPHLVEFHSSQYFACLTCFVRFPSATDLCHHLQTICSLHKIPNTAFLPIDIESSKIAANSLNKIRKKKKYRRTDSEAISNEKEPTHNLRSNSQSTGQDSVTASTSQNDKSEISNNLQFDKNIIIIIDDTSQVQNNPENDESDKELLMSGLSTAEKPHSYLEVDQGDPDKEFQDAIKCFDDDFYSKVTTNVNENLTNYLDGTLTSLPFANSSDLDLEGCETVTVNAIDGFPTLLAVEQYAKGSEDLLQRRPILKHKWKTDASDSDRHSEYDKQIYTLKNNGGHLPQCILPLISGLDIWTQIQMRKKFEDVTSNELTNKNKRKNEQNRKLKSLRQAKSTSGIHECHHTKLTDLDSQNFPSFLGLQYTQSKFETTPALLSGEWARPRCYVCCACGNRSEDPRSLFTHDSTYHPFTQSSHYEVVGKDLLDADILKHLYVPKSQMPKRLRPPRGTHTCTKCGKAVTADELHPHILECAGDTQVVRRKNRNRLFGVRKRRSRVADEDALNHRRARKRARRNKRDRLKQLSLQPRVRTEVGDAETIKKMLENLPAKRHHRESSTLENPSNANKVRKSDWSTMHKKRHAAKLDRNKRHAAALKQEHDELHSNSSSLQFKSMDTIPTIVVDPQVRSTVSGFTDEIPNKSDVSPTEEITTESDKLEIKSTDEITSARDRLQVESPDAKTIIIKDVEVPIDIVGQEIGSEDIKIPSGIISLQTESKDIQIHTETISQQAGSIEIKIHAESISQQAASKDIDIKIPFKSSYHEGKCTTDVTMPIKSIELEVLSISKLNSDPQMAEIQSETVLDITHANKSNVIVTEPTKINKVDKGGTSELPNWDNLNEITKNTSTKEKKDIGNPSISNSNTEQLAEVCRRSCNIINEKSFNNNFETKFSDASNDISQISKNIKPAQLFKPYIDLLEKVPENQLFNKKQCVEPMKFTGPNIPINNTMLKSINRDVIKRPPIISAEKCIFRPHKPKRGLNECISLLIKGKFATDPSTIMTGEQIAPMDLSTGRRDATLQITPMRVSSAMSSCSQEEALDFSTRPFYKASKPPAGTKFDTTNFLSLEKKTTGPLISPEFKNTVGTNTYTQSITIEPKSNEIYCNTSLSSAIPKVQTRAMVTITMEETKQTDSSITVTKNVSLQNITKAIVQSCAEDYNTKIITPLYGGIDHLQLAQAGSHHVEPVSSHENIDGGIMNIPNKREKIIFSLPEPIQTQHWTPSVRKVGQENGTASLRAVRIKSASDKPRNVVTTNEPRPIRMTPETQNGINYITEKLKDVETPVYCNQPNSDSLKLISSVKELISTKSEKELSHNDTIKPQELPKKEDIETIIAVEDSHDVLKSMIVNKEINNYLSNIESGTDSQLDTKLKNDDMNTDCVIGSDVTCESTRKKETEIIVTPKEHEISEAQSTNTSLLIKAKDNNKDKTDLNISANSLTEIANVDDNHIVTERQSISFASSPLSIFGSVEKEVDSKTVLLNDDDTLTSSKLHDIAANSKNIDQKETSSTDMSKIGPSVVHSSEDLVIKSSQKESVLVAINIDNLLVSLNMSEKENKHHNERPACKVHQSSEDLGTEMKRPDHETDKYSLTIQHDNENRPELKVINLTEVKLAEPPKNRLPKKDKSKSKIVHKGKKKTLPVLHVESFKIEEVPIVCPLIFDRETKELRVSKLEPNEPPVASSGGKRLCYDSDDNVPLSFMVGKKLRIRNKSKFLVRNMRKTINKLEKPKLTSHIKIKRRKINKTESRCNRTQLCHSNKSNVSDENDEAEELNQNNNGILIISQKKNELTTENVNIFEYINKVQDYQLKSKVDDLCATTAEKENDNLPEQLQTDELKVIIPADTHSNNEIITTTSTDEESIKRLQSPIVESVASDIPTTQKRKIELCNPAVIRKKPRRRRQNIFREPKRYKKKPTKRPVTSHDTSFGLAEQSNTDINKESYETTLPTTYIASSEKDLQKNKKEAKLNIRRPTRMVKRRKYICRDNSSSESRSTSQDTVQSDSQSQDSLYNVKENLDEYRIGFDPLQPGKLFTRAKKRNMDCLKIHTKSNSKVDEAESTTVMSDSLFSYTVSRESQSKIFDQTKTREKNTLPSVLPEPISETSTDSSSFVCRHPQTLMINKTKSKEGTQGYITESEEESVTLRQLAEVKAGKQKTDLKFKNITVKSTDHTDSSSEHGEKNIDFPKSVVDAKFNLKIDKAESTTVISDSLSSYSVSRDSQSESSSSASRRTRTAMINKTKSKVGTQGYITESEEESVTLHQLAEVKAGKQRSDLMLENITEKSTDLTDSSFEHGERNTNFLKSAASSKFNLEVDKAESTAVTSDSQFSYSVCESQSNIDQTETHKKNTLPPESTSETSTDSSSFVSRRTRTSMLNKTKSKEETQGYITESEEESVTLRHLAEVKAGKQKTVSTLKNITEKSTEHTDNSFELGERDTDSLKRHTESNLKVIEAESTSGNSHSLLSYSVSRESGSKIDQTGTRKKNTLPCLLPESTSETSTDSSSFVSRRTRTSMINKTKSKEEYITESEEESVTLRQLAEVKAGKQKTDLMLKNITVKFTEHTDNSFDLGERHTDFIKMHTKSHLKVNKAESTSVISHSLHSYSDSCELQSKIDPTEVQDKNTPPCLLPEPTSQTCIDSSSFVSRRTRTSMINKTKSKNVTQRYITESEEESVILCQLAEVKTSKQSTDSMHQNITVKSTDYSDSSSEPDFTKYLSTKIKAKQISSLYTESALSSNTQTGLGKLTMTDKDQPSPNVYQLASESANNFDLPESDNNREDFEKHSSTNNSINKFDNTKNQTVLEEKKSTENINSTQIDTYFENFGFYGHRQPRKSNLLASKKIHETFKTNAEDESSQSNSNDAKSVKYKRKRGAPQSKRAIKSKSTNRNTRAGIQISRVPKDKMLYISSQSDSESSASMPLMKSKRVKRTSLIAEPKQITTENQTKKEDMHDDISPMTSKDEANYNSTPQELSQLIFDPVSKNAVIQPTDFLVTGTESKKIIKVGGKELTCDEALFYEVGSLLRNAEGKQAVRLVCGNIITLDNSDPKNIVISFDPPPNDLQGADRNNANSCDSLVSESNQDMSAEDLERSVIKTLMQNRALKNFTEDELNLPLVDKKNESKADTPVLPHVFEDKFDIIKRKSSARSASAVATGRSASSSSGNRTSGNSAVCSVSRLTSTSRSRTSTSFSSRNATNSNQRATARTTKVPTTPTTVITTHPTEDVINISYRNQSANKKIPESPEIVPKAIEEDQVKTIIADILSQPTLINDIEKVPTKAERKGFQGLKKGQQKCPFISRTHKHSLCKQRLRLFFAYRKKLAADSASAKSMQNAVPSRSNANPYDVYDFSDSEDVEEFDCITMAQINKIFDALNKTGADNNYYTEETDSEEDFIYTSGHVFNKKRYGAMSTGSLRSCQLNTNPEKSAVVGKIFKNVARESRNDKIVVENDKQRKRKVGKKTSAKTQSYHENIEKIKEDKENEKDLSGKEKSTLDELFDSLLVTPTVIPLDLADKSQNIEHNAYQSSDYSDSNVATVEPETGIARQRTRRKCAVGKQNVLAESWSSESEEETSYSNYHSTRRKKTNRQPIAIVATPLSPEPPQSQHVRDLVEASTSTSTNQTLRRDCGIFRPAYSLSSSDDEEPHQLVQQHGWIVGNSHKKLVTMLAHAKGRNKEGSRKGGDKDENEFND